MTNEQKLEQIFPHGIAPFSRSWLDREYTEQTKLDEWCTDCKEYDHEKHCCPRFNKVIRSAIKEQTSEDCISREAVCDYIAEFVNHEYSTDAECEMVENMIDGIQHLPSKKGEWIPVTERLPEDDGDGNRVLTTTDEGNVIELIYSKKYGFMRGMFEYSKVIAWQPLPEPYKADKE